MRRSATRLVFALLAVAAVLLAARAIASQWRAFRDSGAHLSPRWSLIALSSVLVLVAYAVLVETWRRTVRAWDAELPWGEAARIWFISNLGRYLPGKVWQIGAMGVMAQEQGVSVVAATGSALVINLVNLLAGFGVVLVTGAEFFEARNAALAFGALLLAGIVLAPRLVPFIGRLAGKVIGRPLDVPTLPDRAVWLAAVGCVVAWLLYGVAFQCFVAGILGQAPGRTSSYIAAFTGSYLAGYIALFAPGGIGVREGSLIFALGRFGLAQAGAAGVISLTSRLWLTVLEVLPGLVFLAVDALRGRRPTSSTPS
ncbi:MAG: flippase-like domain-containing protein [Gemmatimonadetes bacterium]|nr:flippase-like domain-containing protein [Gemmatimonadota bacterium]MBK6456532.1 flippase-like domain-containing protein [Gemmatimonadota bacterium]MBK6842057.1 flippase-like domain-containing protein [Gemmatimonadota bacterium]MBK9407109.1 flippase-like domain-containing protein [Gemmatimonadota bacterium]HNV73522.1 lysylphosphatidylglycerol synthase domain-containing protein [Gemmatimonadaceae bacterium]